MVEQPACESDDRPEGRAVDPSSLGGSVMQAYSYSVVRQTIVHEPHHPVNLQHERRATLPLVPGGVPLPHGAGHVQQIVVQQPPPHQQRQVFIPHHQQAVPPALGMQPVAQFLARPVRQGTPCARKE